MRAKDIKVGHIYYVDFEPIRRGEFDKTHMALVLRKTNKHNKDATNEPAKQRDIRSL